MAEITDPWVRSGWANTYGYALILQARYDEARVLIRSTLTELGVSGFEFGTPHLNWSLAAAEFGLRHFSRCDNLLRKVEHHESYSRDLHLQLNARALRARLELAQQRPAIAVELTRDDLRATQVARCTASILRPAPSHSFPRVSPALQCWLSSGLWR